MASGKAIAETALMHNPASFQVRMVDLQLTANYQGREAAIHQTASTSTNPSHTRPVRSGGPVNRAAMAAKQEKDHGLKAILCCREQNHFKSGQRLVFGGLSKTSSGALMKFRKKRE